MKKPKVSVLMPAYNAADYIASSIQSILNQTYKDLELIIYNDGSTDATQTILHDYEKIDPRIKLITSDINQGLTAGRNILWQAANGDIIAWLDADDLAYPTRIETQVSFLENNPDFVGVSCWARIIDGYGQPTGAFLKNYIKNKHLKAVSLFVNYFVVSGMTMYTSSIPKEGFDPVFSPAEDYDLFVRLLANHQLAILSEVLVDYRVHTNNLTATQSEKMKKAVLGIQKRQLENLRLDVSSDQALLHYDISFAAAALPLKKVEDWLLTIKAANKRQTIYQEKSLNFVLSHRWVKAFERTDRFPNVFTCLFSELFKFNIHSTLILIKKIFVS
jgi:glycosyltransferase involved in cell wall biosynthesis